MITFTEIKAQQLPDDMSAHVPFIVNTQYFTKTSLSIFFCTSLAASLSCIWKRKVNISFSRA